MLGAYDLSMDFPVFCPGLLVNDPYGQLDLQTVSRNELKGSQHKHSTGAHVQSGEEFLERFPVGVYAARKEWK